MESYSNGVVLVASSSEELKFERTMAKQGASRGTTLGHSAENTGPFPDLEITLPDHAH